MLSKEVRNLIKMLRVEKGNGDKRLMAEFPRRNRSLSAVKRLLQKIDATVSADLWVMLFKDSYFSKVNADLYETM